MRPAAIALLLLSACGATSAAAPRGPSDPAPAPAGGSVAPRHAVTPTATANAAEHKAAYARATSLATGGDIPGAIRELAPFAAANATGPEDPLAYWIHNELTWLQWGAGDVRTALAETDSGSQALDRSTLPKDDVASMRLHALWDRAYLLLELHDARADEAFASYEALATARADHDGLAVLTAFFAARRGKAAEAMAAAKRVDVAHDSDIQDLYVIALALDLGGDAPAARAVRARICRANPYLMKPLILAQLTREGFACPA